MSHKNLKFSINFLKFTKTSKKMDEISSQLHQRSLSSDQILTDNNETYYDEHLPYYKDWMIEDKRRYKRIKKFLPNKYQKKSFKEAVRQGIGKEQRYQVYLFLNQLDQKLIDFSQQWNDVVERNSNPQYENVITLFGSPCYEFEAPKQSFHKFLTIFANEIQTETFSPIIPGVASILFISFQQDVAFFVLKSMYEQGNKYFTKTKREFAIMLDTIECILSNYPRIYDKAKSLKIDFKEIALFVIPLLFSEKIDAHVSHTIFDSFVHDGRLIFIRYVVGIILILQPSLLTTNSAIEFMNVIKDYLMSLNSPSKLLRLIHVTFAEKQAKSKKVIACLLQQENEMAKISDDQINSLIISPLPKIENFIAYHQCKNNNNHQQIGPLIPLIKIINSKVYNGQLMTDLQFHTIKTMLPYSMFGRFNAYLVYKMNYDGSAMPTFLAKCKGAKKSMIVIKTENKTIGAVLTQELSLGYHGRYTNSFTWLFDLTKMVVYKKTSKNDYCVSLEKDSLTIGGGELGCAIYIDQFFEYCSSYPCLTFDSPSLLSPNEKEEIQDIEVYKLCY